MARISRARRCDRGKRTHRDRRIAAWNARRCSRTSSAIARSGGACRVSCSAQPRRFDVLVEGVRCVVNAAHAFDRGIETAAVEANTRPCTRRRSRAQQGSRVREHRAFHVAIRESRCVRFPRNSTDAPAESWPSSGSSGRGKESGTIGGGASGPCPGAPSPLSVCSPPSSPSSGSVGVTAAKRLRNRFHGPAPPPRSASDGAARPARRCRSRRLPPVAPPRAPPPQIQKGSVRPRSAPGVVRAASVTISAAGSGAGSGRGKRAARTRPRTPSLCRTSRARHGHAHATGNDFADCEAVLTTGMRADEEAQESGAAESRRLARASPPSTRRGVVLGPGVGGALALLAALALALRRSGGVGFPQRRPRPRAVVSSPPWNRFARVGLRRRRALVGRLGSRHSHSVALHRLPRAARLGTPARDSESSMSDFQGPRGPRLSDFCHDAQLKSRGWVRRARAAPRSPGRVIRGLESAMGARMHGSGG